MKHVIFGGVKMAKIPTPRLVSYSRWQGFFPRISSGRVKPRSGGCVLHQGWKRSFCGTHTKRSPQWSCHSRNHFALAEDKVNKTCLNLAGQRPLYISLLCMWYKYEYMVLQLCWYQSYMKWHPCMTKEIFLHLPPKNHWIVPKSLSTFFISWHLVTRCLAR